MILDFDSSLRCEWLETNGLGGFASSTIPGVNTRRYHGLLVAALHPPVGRYVLLSKVEETVFLNGERYELSANLYPGTTHPQGYKYLRSFERDPWPTFIYEVGGVEIEKRVFMAHGENTTVVEYSVRGGAQCTLELCPLIAFRDYHSTTHANDALNPEVWEEPGMLSVEPYRGLPRLYLGHNARWTARAGSWYFNFEYPRERERGLDYREDLFQPLVLQFEIGAGKNATVIASTERREASMAGELRQREIDRRASLRVPDPLISELTAAADRFIVKRAGDLHTVIAGYHWFADWGRDTMISLPGLTLATGRFEIARDILLAFSRAADMGMLPNRFPDAGDEPEYNTADASLWFFEAVRKFLEYTGEYAFVRDNLYDTMKSILAWHLNGTRYGIHCDADGLLSAGGPDTQLTWMDAKIGDFVATPRYGKPVEIQALWYNALRFTEALARRFEDPEEEKLLAGIAPRTLESFNAAFWNEEAGCLFDVVNDDGKDASIRPNQVIALSLGYGMVPEERARQILYVVERELLTPYGLRTLSPSDPHYCGHCDGGPFDRDSSYHQGTVWPWLLGPYVTACAKIWGEVRNADYWMIPLQQYLNEAGLGTLPEIFDGDAPHRARGCIAQAWTVAEILRVISEDLLAKPGSAA